MRSVILILLMAPAIVQCQRGERETVVLTAPTTPAPTCRTITCYDILNYPFYNTCALSAVQGYSRRRGNYYDVLEMGPPQFMRRVFATSCVWR